MADTIETLAYDAGRLIRHLHSAGHEEFESTARQLLAIATGTATATPPADAALADSVNLLATWRDELLEGEPRMNARQCMDFSYALTVALAALRARAVPDGMALVDVNLIDDEWMKAAMRDAGIVRAVGAPPGTIIRAAISGYLLAASKEGK